MAKVQFIVVGLAHGVVYDWHPWTGWSAANAHMESLKRRYNPMLIAITPEQ